MKVNFVSAVNNSSVFVPKKQNLKEEKPVPQEETALNPENYSKNYCKNNIIFNGCGEALIDTLKFIDNASIGEKIAAGLKNLSQKEYLIIAKDTNAVLEAAKRAACVLEAPINVYYIENEYYDGALLFRKNADNKNEVINIEYEPVMVTTAQINPFEKRELTNKDEIWSQNWEYSKKSIKINDEKNVDKLVKYQMLFLKQLNDIELSQISGTVYEHPLTTNHVH